MNEIRTKIINDINLERKRQDVLHPQKLSLPMRFVTVSEEMGEIAEAMQDKNTGRVYCEIIDAAATLVRMAEELLKGDE